MITEDQMRTLFVEANPVPDPDALDLTSEGLATDLAEFTRRSNDMTDLKTRKTQEESRPKPEGRWLVAAFVILVLGIGAVVAFQARDSGPVVADPDLTEIDVAMAAIDTYNTGDFEAWLEYWAPVGDERDLADEQFLTQILMAANERVEVTEPCVIVSTGQTRTVVECGIYVVDDFHAAGGIDSTGEWRLVFDENMLLVDTTNDLYEDEAGNCCRELENFHHQFHSWLSTAHPDVFAEIGPDRTSDYWYFPGFAKGDPSHMTIALQYVDEFVAQSDNYPIDS